MCVLVTVHLLLNASQDIGKITHHFLGVNAIRWCGEYDRLYTAGRDSIIRKWSLQDNEAKGMISLMADL